MSKSKDTKTKSIESAKRVGRPRLVLSEDEQDSLCLWVSTANGLLAWCEKTNHGWLPVNNFIADNPEFQQKYARAREAHAEYLVESKAQILRDLDLSLGFDQIGNRHLDAGILGLAKLRVEQLDKTAAQLAPKKFGPKLDVTSGGNEIKSPASMTTAEILAKLKEIDGGK